MQHFRDNKKNYSNKIKINIFLDEINKSKEFAQSMSIKYDVMNEFWQLMPSTNGMNVKILLNNWKINKSLVPWSNK